MYSRDELSRFIHKAAAATYAGGGQYDKQPERAGFKELVYSAGDFSYRDSYTGYTRSRGMEVVRYKNTPVWTSLYGGGMIEGKEKLADETFNFLKKCMMANKDFESFRGPRNLKDGDWEYKYTQEGDMEEFNGYEEIHYQGELVFFHRVIGGLVNN